MNGIGAGHHQPQDGVSALVVCHPLLVRFAQDDGALGPEQDLLERVYEILVVALSCWRRAASRAASFTRFLMSAPETPQPPLAPRSEEHTSELQSLMRISYAVFCLKKQLSN